MVKRFVKNRVKTSVPGSCTSSNKKCGKDEVFELVRNSLEKQISREIFESLLYRFIEKQYVKLNVLGKRICLSLPKET